MSRPLSQRIYTEVLSKWPKQDLRPDYQLQDVLRTAIDSRYASHAFKPFMEAEELFKARSLQVLQQNRFMEKYKLTTMLEPKSQPNYFNDLVQEIAEAPKRSWFGRLGKRLSGMIRLQ